jgi:tRNA(Ile)-lysidine synthase
MARAPRRGPLRFSPSLLGARLKQLLPGFPDVAVCVAFSGGADSTALLAALAQPRRPRLRLRAVHIDHRLRPDSASWSAHCRRMAATLGVELAVRRLRVPRRRGESLEAAARQARYAALAAALKPGEVLLSAHHADDQLETVLLQLLRGAGAAGLAAMPAIAPFGRTLLVRPLLGVTAVDLRAWVSERRLAWVEDDSNTDERLDRNYLRRQVVPAICARWPSAAATVARSAQHLGEAQRLLDALGAADVARAEVGEALSAKVLRALTPERRRNALRHWIARAGALAPPARRLEELAGAVLAARPDTHPCVAWGGAQVRREADLLWLRIGALSPPSQSASEAGPEPPKPLTWHWQRQRALVLPAARGTLTLRADARGPLDLDALAPQLTLRARQGGERLRPFAGGARRALKGLLQEARVPVEERARLPLIYCGDTLVAVGDRWLDVSVQASAGTRRRGRLSYRATG